MSGLSRAFQDMCWWLSKFPYIHDCFSMPAPPPQQIEVPLNLVETTSASRVWNIRLLGSILASRSSNLQSEYRTLISEGQRPYCSPWFQQVMPRMWLPSPQLPAMELWGMNRYHYTNWWNILKLTAIYKLSFPLEAANGQINSRVPK